MSYPPEPWDSGHPGEGGGYSDVPDRSDVPSKSDIVSLPPFPDNGAVCLNATISVKGSKRHGSDMRDYCVGCDDHAMWYMDDTSVKTDIVLTPDNARREDT